MFDMNCFEISSLHQEAIYRQATTARLLRSFNQPRLSLAERTLPALGNLLIRLGLYLKDAPRRLEAEPASLSSLTIIL